MAEVSIHAANDSLGPAVPGPETQSSDVRSLLAPEINNVSAYGDVQGASAPQSVEPKQPSFERSEPTTAEQRERDIAGPGE